jgi:hypothetical protein
VTQARWRLTHLLPADDPQQIVALPPSVAVGGVLCNEWFERWQEAKTARRSRVRVNMKRGERNPRRPVTGLLVEVVVSGGRLDVAAHGHAVKPHRRG